MQVDTGWVPSLEPDDAGVRRRKKAFVFMPNVSRYRFVYPIERETTEEAIAACEAACAFYGGMAGYSHCASLARLASTFADSLSHALRVRELLLAPVI